VSGALASRYQPVLVALHWFLALMIIGLLCLGFFVLADMPNTDPKKLDILVWHMSGGMFVLVLMIVRLIIRIWSARPATLRQVRPCSTGWPRLRTIACM
jgi:cytochrome b561